MTAKFNTRSTPSDFPPDHPMSDSRCPTIYKYDKHCLFDAVMAAVEGEPIIMVLNESPIAPSLMMKHIAEPYLDGRSYQWGTPDHPVIQFPFKGGGYVRLFEAV